MSEKNEALLLAEKMERKYSGCHEDEDGFLEMDAVAELRRLTDEAACAKVNNWVG
jgi:hypothetical protein